MLLNSPYFFKICQMNNYDHLYSTGKRYSITSSVDIFSINLSFSKTI